MIKNTKKIKALKGHNLNDMIKPEVSRNMFSTDSILLGLDLFMLYFRYVFLWLSMSCTHIFHELHSRLFRFSHFVANIKYEKKIGLENTDSHLAIS